MKLFLIATLAIISTVAEPPVDNRYLPPQIGGARAPSQNYGVPSQDFGAMSQNYRAPSQSYGPPSQSYGPPSQNYGPPSPNFGGPSQTYGAPASGPGQQRQTAAIFRSHQPTFRSRKPNAQYLPPSTTYQPSSQYGAPALATSAQQYRAPGLSSGVPSQQYGAPSFGGAASGVFGAEQSRQYLPPGRSGYDREGGEPANYSFEYMVNDPPSGNDFGHREGRQGDRAEGQYYVLLPDGRKQTVDYEADEEGYRPRISYEDTGLGAGSGLGLGGYDRNSQHQGY